MTGNSRFEQAVKLAEQYSYEKRHSHNVLELSEQLYDQLGEVHGLGNGHRELLRCGAVLHDIGWVMGKSKHHKNSAQIILEDKRFELSSGKRKVTALIARYHRKSLPEESHNIYNKLDEEKRQLVWLLGGIVRLADGLDRTHLGVIDKINCRVNSDSVDIHCHCRGFYDAELATGNKKKEMLEKALNKKITLHMTNERS
jgi:exopolyphosphatase/guanosine-5'-triphosphate,3'-diphosphate pyrophosphatase